MLNCYMQKSIKNRLRRWDFCTPVSLSDGQRSKCADLAELLPKIQTIFIFILKQKQKHYMIGEGLQIVSYSQQIP